MKVLSCLSSKKQVCFLFALVAATVLGTTASRAQYGVSPSQTGAFFDDLRGRAGTKFDRQTTRTSGEYDFSGNSYDGAQPGSVFDDANRQISQGYNGMGNLIYSQRQSADYTQYSGPYPAQSSYFAPPYTSDPLLGGKRNLKLGPVNIGLGLTSMVEFNDNITRSSTDKVSDMIGSAYLNVSANYPLTEKTSLSLSTAIGFDHYFDHPELAPYGGDFVLNVLPGSTIAIDGKIGPVYVVLYDRVSVRPAMQNYNTLGNQSIFGVFQNDAGFGANWAVNSKLNMSLNYTRSDSLALQDQDKIYERSMDSLQASLAWSPTGTWTAGLEGGYSWLTYPEHYNNDGTLANVGAFFAMPIGKSTSIRLSGGFQDFSFDPPDTAVANRTGDNSDLSDYYYNVTISNRLNARIAQALNFGHESSLNTTSNFITADYVSYGLSFILGSGSRLAVSGYYENAHDSGGLLAEDIEQYGLDVYLSQQLTSRLRVGLGYHYGVSNSDSENRDYTQNAFNVDLNYLVSRKLTLTAGYRYFTTSSDNSEFEFDQNRVILSANYNF